VTLTALSLSHLSHGIEIVTGAQSWESWAMAVGIDLGFVALELAQIATVAERVRKQIGKYARPAILGTLVGSAGNERLRIRRPDDQSVDDGRGGDPGGRRIPSLIYALTRVGAALYIDCHSRG